MLFVVAGFLILSISAFGPEASAEILFQSDFECGETYLAKAIKPGVGKIPLLPNHKLDEWPTDGGIGIVEGNLPASADSFRYAKRVGAILKKVTGIAKTHPQYADVRTGNLTEWTRAGLVVAPNSNWLKIDNQPAMQGNFAARFDPANSVCYLSAPLPTNRKIYYTRFLVRFSQDLLNRELVNLPLCQMTIGRNHIQRIDVIKSGSGEEAFLHLSPRGLNTVVRNRIEMAASPIVPNRTFRVEYRAALQEPNGAIVTLALDGVELETQSATYDDKESAMGEFRLGKVNVAGSPGGFIIDDVWLSDSVLPLQPGKPVITLMGSRLTGSPFDNLQPGYRHAATHWQISTDNSWLLPVFSSGDDVGNLKKLDFPFAVSLAGTLAGTIALSSQTSAKTALEPKTEYFARCRYRNGHGVWTSWSTPAKLLSPPLQDAGRAKQKDTPVLDRAFFAMPGKSAPLSQLEKDQWYDLHIRFKSPESKHRIAYADVYLCGKGEDCLANYRNRGGPYHPESNLGVSFSFADNEIYYKTPDGWMTTSDMGVYLHPPYIDDNEGKLPSVADANEATIKMKFPLGARPGPWVISAFAMSDKEMFSQMYSDVILLSGPKTADSADSHLVAWILATILAVALSGILMFRLGKRRASVIVPAVDTDAVESKSADTGEEGQMGRRVQKAMEFIRQNYTRDLSTKEVAESVSLSPKYFGRIFANASGTTITNYINELRVEEAKRLLRQTEKNVTEIAYSVGYNSLEHFSHVFRSIEQISPREFRNKS